MRVIPSDRERYSSSAVDSRTSGDKRVMITVGERINGMASSVIQAADTLVRQMRLETVADGSRGARTVVEVVVNVHRIICALVGSVYLGAVKGIEDDMMVNVFFR